MSLYHKVGTLFWFLLVGLPGHAMAEPQPGHHPTASVHPAPIANEDEASKLIRSIQQLLIAKLLCADLPDCSRKQFALAATVYAGLNVYVYQLSDPELLSDVIKQCALVALRRPDMRRIELKIYAVSKAEHLDTPFFVRVPYKAITIAN